MAGLTLYSLSEAARILGKEHNRRLLRGLIRHHGIEMHRVGRDNILDQEGLDALKAAVEAWDSRPRLKQATAATS